MHQQLASSWHWSRERLRRWDGRELLTKAPTSSIRSPTSAGPLLGAPAACSARHSHLSESWTSLRRSGSPNWPRITKRPRCILPGSARLARVQEYFQNTMQDNLLPSQARVVVAVDRWLGRAYLLVDAGQTSAPLHPRTLCLGLGSA